VSKAKLARSAAAHPPGAQQTAKRLPAQDQQQQRRGKLTALHEGGAAEKRMNQGDQHGPHRTEPKPSGPLSAMLHPDGWRGRGLSQAAAPRARDSSGSWAPTTG